MFHVNPLSSRGLTSNTKSDFPWKKKNNEKVFMNVVCCSRDWRFKG